MTGLSRSPIEYGAGVTALNINGGTSAGRGVTYDINNTQAGTTTTINGGPNANIYNLSNSAEAGGLDNLPGPVVINGGGAGDVVTLRRLRQQRQRQLHGHQYDGHQYRPLRRLDLRRPRGRRDL